jgi:hypothetical protein
MPVVKPEDRLPSPELNRQRVQKRLARERGALSVAKLSAASDASSIQDEAARQVNLESTATDNDENPSTQDTSKSNLL